MIKIVLLLAGNILFNSAGNILMKVGMERTQGKDLSGISGIFNNLVLNPALVIGAFAYVGSLAFYIFTLRKLDLSIAYPIAVSCAAIVVTVASGLLLKENISITQIIGMAIIMLGIFVLTR